MLVNGVSTVIIPPKNLLAIPALAIDPAPMSLNLLARPSAPPVNPAVSLGLASLV